MSDERATLTESPFSGSWEALPGSISQARAALSGYAFAAGASQRTRDAVALAVSEAVANAVMHGYPQDAAPGVVQVNARVLDVNHLQVVVRDDGCGMDDGAQRAGLGLGLALITQLTESVAIVSAPRDGTTVRMDFLLLT